MTNIVAGTIIAMAIVNQVVKFITVLLSKAPLWLPCVKGAVSEAD